MVWEVTPAQGITGAGWGIDEASRLIKTQNCFFWAVSLWGGRAGAILGLWAHESFERW